MKGKTQKSRKPARAKRAKPIDLRPLKGALSGVEKIARRGLKEGPAFDPEANVPAMRAAAQELQEAVAGFKREIKRRLLVDPRLKHGAIRTKNRIVRLRLRPDARPGSKNPDDYDIVAESIH